MAGDTKYGRLFTEADVLAIVDEALMAGRDGFDDLDAPPGERMLLILEALIERAEADKAPMRFPADEPLFLLRGQDGAALYAVGCYGAISWTMGAGVAHAAAVNLAARQIGEWQEANPGRVKIPD